MEDESPKKFESGDTPETNGDNDTPESRISIGLEYFLNEEDKKEGTLIINNFTGKCNKISYEEIVYSFYLFLETITLPDEIKHIKPDHFTCEFIRYLYRDGWVLLGENEFIYFDDYLGINNLKIMIKATIYTDDEFDIIKKCDTIKKEIDYTYKEMLEKNLDNSPTDIPLNLIVLNANPLMNGKNELRTMNDFNIITSTIFKLFDNEDYLKYTKFGLLTMKTLKDILTNKTKIPVILHLICKSTYIKDNESNKYIANLIFEKNYFSGNGINNYNLKFVNEKTLKKELFEDDSAEEIKENIKKITLIISTQLAEDVYNIFKDFEFKNILVQHTTLADVNFIAEFNKIFYQDLIRHLDKPINTIFENAFITSNEEIDFKTFCCCFHNHKDSCSCSILENLQNEIYNDKNSKIVKNLTKEEKLKEMEIYIPHFYHLFPLCTSYIKKHFKSNEKNKYYSFSSHLLSCKKYMNYVEHFSLDNTKRVQNFCCCNINSKNHNINMIFQKDFNEEDKNNKIQFRKAGTLRENLNLPNYKKLKLLVGKNKAIFQALQFFFRDDYNYCNIYGDNMENLKIFGSILKEYYRERYYFYELYNNEENEKEKDINEDISLKKNISQSILKDSINSELENMKIIDIDINLNRKISQPSSFYNRQIKGINEMDYENFIKENTKLNFNIIYFLYVFDAKLIKSNLRDKNKIIFFSEEPLGIIGKIQNIQLIKEPKLQTEEKYYKNILQVSLNEYIKFQHVKDVQNWRKIININF